MNILSARLIDQTVEVVEELLKFTQPADATLSRFFRARHCGSSERAFIAEAAYAVLRRMRSLAAWIGGAPDARRLTLAALVRHGGISLRLLEPALAESERQWLADLKARSDAALDFGAQTDLPDWLIERLRAQMPDEALLKLARALNQPAPLDLRVNILKTRRADALARLNADGITARACPYAPAGIRVSGKPSLAKHPLFLDGSLEVQDEGSQLLGHLVAPKRGEMVVDFCAGAGGKTLLLGALMRSTGRVYAFDVSARRLAKLQPRLARSGLSNVHPVVIDSENDVHIKRLSGKCDRVLVDAPCSGLGVLRRNPDLKWRLKPQDIAELTVKQAAILASAARLLKPGGRLVYATCSLLAEENTAIVNAFLATHPDFVRRHAGEILAAQGIRLDQAGEDLHLLPDVHETDGFYAAVLERAR
jgi:16S rRNA (cytosine967-C5)-methyltransferase